MKDVKLNRPSVGLSTLAALGVPAMDNSQESRADLATFLKRVMFGAGVNHIVQVNDCETAADWTESDGGTLDVAAGATGKRVGTNCMKLTSTGACDGTQYVQTKLVDESALIGKQANKRQQDWSDTEYLGFWIHNESAGDFSTAGEMKVALVYGGGNVSDKVDIQALVDDVHQWWETALSEFNCPLDKIEALRFYANVGAGEDLYVDDILRYLISVDGRPYYGCSFPIKSGTTLVQGNSAKWTVDGLITGAADAPTLGPVFLPDGASVTGVGARSKWGMFAGPVRIGIQRANAATTAGDLLEWVSGTDKALLTDVTTTTTEKGYAIALEAAGAQYDDIFVAFMPGFAAD